jgi:hypothetical protein
VIVTVTLNTALGVRYQAREVVWDATNQVRRVSYPAAGRGVAVARVLHTFGHEVIAAGLHRRCAVADPRGGNVPPTPLRSAPRLIA